ncbi:CRISPR-associated protein [Nocardia nova SH22a]|uniref:CRISPR-associated protein n=1 Tax=Nocardia nova SH22a TaxID=1415166 RepID=W5TGY3_9NOCA|nr:type I-E CRISPR-associated protein Cas6/Cse3/CasE [Nocardia nova]AHH16501.1 CRISPR-associated protein [Nocardia nova SH22a]
MTTSPDNGSAAARFVTTHSILTLDARHPFVLKSLHDAQDMHRTVMSGFLGWVEDGQPEARKLMGVLSTWSLNLRESTLIIVVQANVPADWSRIPSNAMKDKPHTITVDKTIRTGNTYTFRTVVNPTRDRNTPKSIAEPGTRTRKRTPHQTPKWAESWFTDRLQPPGEPPIAPSGTRRIGATTDPNTLTVRMLPTVSSSGAHPGLRIIRAELKGTLTVTDPKTFVEALHTGIGRARAYSAGLLLIRD